MLPRWLTALPRFARTWRDEIAVVAVGIAYQAVATGALGVHHERRYEPQEVVVRIAAPAPRAVSAHVPHGMTDFGMPGLTEGQVYTEAPPADVRVKAARLRAVRTAPAPRPALRPEPHVAPLAHVAPLRHVAPVPSVSALARGIDRVSRGGLRAMIVDGSAAAPRRARVILTNEAGENIAADIAAGIEIDTVVLPEIRASFEQAKAAMDETRVRAALQRALAAERALPRAGPGV
jgi:hypothetical protein